MPNEKQSENTQSEKKLSPVEAAQLGESMRMSGNYSDAIRYFSEAVRGKSNYAWAYAHRAAARGALGDFKRAFDDVLQARTHHPGSYPWLDAQEGDLYRELARALIGGTDPLDGFTKKPEFYLDLSLKAFNRAIEARKDSPWVYAHRGATYTTRYWIYAHFNQRATQVGMVQPDHDATASGEAPGADDDFSAARSDFEKACQLNPSYGWAYMFHSFLEGLHGNLQKSGELIGKAQLAGLDRAVLARTVLMELNLYSRTDEGYKSAVNMAWQALQDDVDNGFARYFVADGLAQLKGNSAFSQSILDGMDKAAIWRAREALKNMQARILAMLGGLDCLEGKTAAASEKLKEVLRSGDMEALALIHRDPAWDLLLKSGSNNETKK